MRKITYVVLPLQFMDRAQIETQGGRGGNGCVSFEGKNRCSKRGVRKLIRVYIRFLKVNDE
jgi:hypothetical protein